jgi:hypothetical protein
MQRSIKPRIKRFKPQRTSPAGNHFDGERQAVDAAAYPGGERKLTIADPKVGVGPSCTLQKELKCGRLAYCIGRHFPLAR